MSLPQARADYRPDIDGLRAVAVLAVVIFHLNKEWLPGGFAGVDVFFVISGFLITGILSRRMAVGTFSFTEFYLSRARRILPATFFCILLTLVAGTHLLLPDDAAALGASAAASAVWAANMYFWTALDTSYFATSSEMVPLLHLWSLSVEEQFYLVWPLLLLLMQRWLPVAARHVMLVVLAAVSYQLGQHYLASDPGFAYYMLPARAGELIMGGLAYGASTRLHNLSSLLRNLLALIGAALTAWSIASLSEAKGFPGHAALAPTLGTALLLLAGSHGRSLVGYVLAMPPLVAVGRISFSLYLWHWPVMALYRYGWGQPATLAAYAGCVAVIVVLTLVSYFLVEKPFRHASVPGIAWPAARFAGISAGIAMLGMYVLLSGGGSALFKPAGYVAKLEQLDADTKPAMEYAYNCQLGSMDEAVLDDPRCVLGNPDKPVRTLLWGDSHAAHYVGYFKVLAQHHDIAVRNVSMSSCMPLFENSASYTAPSLHEACSEFNARMRQEVANYDTVVLGSAWVAFDRDNAREDIARTVAELSARVPNVVIALSVPLFLDYDRQCERKALRYPAMRCQAGRPFSAGVENGTNDNLVALAARFPNVSTFDVHPQLCGDDICYPTLQGKPVYFDAGHLSMAGSQMLGDAALASGTVPAFLTGDGGAQTMPAAASAKNALQ